MSCSSTRHVRPFAESVLYQKQALLGVLAAAREAVRATCSQSFFSTPSSTIGSTAIGKDGLSRSGCTATAATSWWW